MVTNWGSTNPLWATHTATTTSNYFVNQSSTISIAPTPQPAKTPLDWLREQVDEVCQLARVP